MIDLKHKNIPTYVVLKRKSVLLAAEMRLTSLDLMFLFFFELPSTTIPRRTAMMCLWNEVETIENAGKMVDTTGVLSSSRFCPTNIKVLSLLFTEYTFSLPSHAGNTFLIGFMFYQCLLGVVTHKKCDVTGVLSFPFLARHSQGPATWLVKRDNVHET